MSHKVETMAYANETPWHGLGFKVTDKLTPEQMAKAAGIDWTVSKREVFFKDSKGKMVTADDEFALVRDSDDKKLSMVGSVYRPFQNLDTIDFYKKFVEAGNMSMETMGSLDGGRYIWALAKLGKDFKIGKDEVRGFLLMSSPHVHGKSALYQFTAIRVVCWNTLSWALGADLKGDKSAFRMPHTAEFTDSTKERAENALGLASEQMEQFEEVAVLLSKKKMTTADNDDFFFNVVKFKPEEADKKKDGEVKEPRMIPQFRAALEHSPGATMPSAKGTLWGAVNAVTYVIDHNRGRGDQGTALKNAWLGHKATIKRRAFDLALDLVKS